MGIIMNVVEHIVDSYFSGVDAHFAKWIGKNSANIWRWKNGNSIPPSHQREILKKSDDEGLGMTPEDFFPDRMARGQTAPSNLETAQ